MRSNKRVHEIFVGFQNELDPKAIITEPSVLTLQSIPNEMMGQTRPVLKQFIRAYVFNSTNEIFCFELICW